MLELLHSNKYYIPEWRLVLSWFGLLVKLAGFSWPKQAPINAFISVYWNLNARRARISVGVSAVSQYIGTSRHEPHPRPHFRFRGQNYNNFLNYANRTDVFYRLGNLRLKYKCPRVLFAGGNIICGCEWSSQRWKTADKLSKISNR